MTDNSAWPHPLIDPEDSCQDFACSRVNGRCVSIHCVHCGQSCGIYGHAGCLARASEERAIPEPTEGQNRGE